MVSRGGGVPLRSTGGLKLFTRLSQRQRIPRSLRNINEVENECIRKASSRIEHYPLQHQPFILYFHTAITPTTYQHPRCKPSKRSSQSNNPTPSLLSKPTPPPPPQNEATAQQNPPCIPPLIYSPPRILGTENPCLPAACQPAILLLTPSVLRGALP